MDKKLPIVVLQRVEITTEGVFGKLFFGGQFLCFTCEDPWNNNKVGESCIPKGEYICVPHSGPKYKNVWEVTAVPGRSAVLIHQGNTILDTRGCILVGSALGTVYGKRAVLNSVNTLNKLRSELPRKFILRIV